MGNAKEAFAEAMVALGSLESLSSISVDDLAKKAGYSRWTFYKNYADKSDLVRQIYMNDVMSIVQKYGSYSYESFIENILPLLGKEQIHSFLEDRDKIIFEKRKFYCNAFCDMTQGTLRQYFEELSCIFWKKYVQMMRIEKHIDLPDNIANMLAKYHAAGQAAFFCEKLLIWNKTNEYSPFFTGFEFKFIRDSIISYLKIHMTNF